MSTTAPEVRSTRHAPALEDDEITGYAAVFDTPSADLGGFREEVRATAFAKTVGEADVLALVDHQRHLMLGRTSSGTLKLTTDARGLHYSVSVPNTQVGRDAAEQLRRGDMRASSFAFLAVRDRWDRDGSGYPRRSLDEVRLIDVGPTALPAYPTATAEVTPALRSLSTAFDLDLVDVLAAAEERRLGELLPEAPGAPVPVVGARRRFY